MGTHFGLCCYHDDNNREIFHETAFHDFNKDFAAVEEHQRREAEKFQNKLQDVSVSHLTMGNYNNNEKKCPTIDKEICYVRTVDEGENPITPRARIIVQESAMQFEYSPLCTKRDVYQCDETKCRQSEEISREELRRMDELQKKMFGGGAREGGVPSPFDEQSSESLVSWPPRRKELS